MLILKLTGSCNAFPCALSIEDTPRSSMTLSARYRFIGAMPPGTNLLPRNLRPLLVNWWRVNALRYPTRECYFSVRFLRLAKYGSLYHNFNYLNR